MACVVAASSAAYGFGIGGRSIRAVLDLDATLAQRKSVNDARLVELTTQREHAERELRDVATQRANIERDYLAQTLPADKYVELDAKLLLQQIDARARADDLRAQEQEWTPDDLIDTATLEQLTELRREVVERVRDGGDVEGVRAALLSLFDAFTLRAGQIELTPRDWTIASNVDMHRETIVMPEGREVTGVWPVDEDADVHADSVVRKAALSGLANCHSSDSPSQ